MSGRTFIALPLVSAEMPLAEQVRAAEAAGADLVEFRVDCIADAAAVEKLFARPHALPFILTVRALDEGGAWTGDEAERIALFERLGLRLPGYVDVEHATWQRSANLRQKIGLVVDGPDDEATGRAGERGRRTKNRLILSHHNLRDTPAELDLVFDQLAATPAHIIKAVFAARDATDACRVLQQLHRRAGERAVIALATGEAGLITRVLARKFGAFLTFAALRAGAESAPGQPTMDELRRLYRWDQIGSATRVYGVVGWPVSHSQGPALHNAALTAAGIDGVYLPLPVQPEYADLVAFMAELQRSPALDVVGLSITLPHKEHALRWLDEHGFAVSPLARRVGAVNTLTRGPDGTWAGDNTDVAGVLTALGAVPRCAGDALRAVRVAILGAGGVARAAAVALLEQGCAVTFYNRSAERAERLAQELRCAWRPWAARRRYVGDLLINCTSVGLWPVADETPISPEALRPETLVFDTVYRPADTALLRAAAQRGCECISGAAMFIGQAAAQFARWHGRMPDIDIIRRVMASSPAPPQSAR